jgi:hypothetical protein
MNKFLLPVLAVSATLLYSCSTTQLARQASSDDDVYYTEAKAIVVEPVVAEASERTNESANETSQPTARSEQSYRTDEQLYGDVNDSDRYYDDYSYSNRINRFYYNSPFRPYYDYRYDFGYNPWYTGYYDPFFYDPWFYRPGVSVWVGAYPRYRYGYNYGFYGSRFNNGFWGPYSYYNTYPGYGYGGYRRNGYYYGGGSGYSNPSRPRPNREGNIGRADNTIDYPSSGGSVPVGGRPSRGSYVPNGNDKQSPGRISSDQGSTAPADQSSYGTRPSRRTSADEAKPRERISSEPGSSSAQPSSSGSSRPTRTREADQSRQSEPSPRPTYSRPERSSSPSPSYGGGNSGGSSSGGSSSGGSSSGSSGGGRPSRGGR